MKDETVTSIRSRLDVNMDLEISQAYTDWVISLIRKIKRIKNASAKKHEVFRPQQPWYNGHADGKVEKHDKEALFLRKYVIAA